MRMKRIPAMLTALVLIAGQGVGLTADTVYAAQIPVYAVTPAGSAGEEIGGMPLPSETAPGDEAVSPAGEEEPGEGDGILPEEPAPGEDGSDITADSAGEDPEAGDPADGEGEDAEEADGEMPLAGEGEETDAPADVLTPVENGPEEILGGQDILQVQINGNGRLDFGTAAVGYTAAQRPAAQTVLVKNNGDDTLTLELPAVTNAELADRWEISKPAKLTLNKGETISFTVRPKTGIVSTMHGDQTENAAFDLSVKTADGAYTAGFGADLLVGLKGNIPVRSLATAYGEADTAILIEDTKLTLTAGEDPLIGGICPASGTDTAPALTICGTGSIQTGRIRAGALTIDAGAKLSCTSGIEAERITVSKGCELTAVMDDAAADGEIAATVKCGSILSSGTVQITGFGRGEDAYYGILAGDIEIPEGSFTVTNPSMISGAGAIGFRKSMKIGHDGSGAIPAVTALCESGYAIYCANANDQDGLIVSGKARILARTETASGYGAIVLENASSEVKNLRLGIDDGEENQLTNSWNNASVQFFEDEDHNCWTVCYGSEPSISSMVLVEPKEEAAAGKASVSISAKTLRFAGVEGEEAPAAQQVVIRNTGDVPLCLENDQVILDQKDPDYMFTQTGRYFLPGETVTLTVSLKADTIPAADKGPYTADLRIKRIDIPSGGYLKEDAAGESAGIAGEPDQALQIGIPISLDVTPAFTVTPSGGQNGEPVDLGETVAGQKLEPVTFVIRNNGTSRQSFGVRVVKSDNFIEQHGSLITDQDPGREIEVEAGGRLYVSVSSVELTETGELNGRLSVSMGDIEKLVPLKATVIDAPTGLAIKAVPDRYYDGTAQKPVPQVWFGNTRLTEADYSVTYTNNTNAASKDSNRPPTVTVRGKGNFVGTCSTKFNILQRSVAGAEAENDELVKDGRLPANQILTANGSVQKGRFVLKYTYADGRVVTLKENTDYTLDYGGISPKEAGLYPVTVNGKGNYTGSRTVLLAIVDPGEKTLISRTTIPAIPNQVYSGRNYILRAAGAVCGADETFVLDASKKQFSFTIKKGSQVLRYGRDYTLSYTDNCEVGTATVTIIGTGSYTGSVTKTFKITGKALSSVKQTGFAAKLLYTGAPVSQPLVFHDAAKDVDRDLEEGTDYTVTCLEGEAMEPGTYNLVYTGKGLYTGTVKKSFTIVSDIGICTLDRLAASYEWTGNPIDPFGMTEGARLVIGERTLRKDTDYSYAITNNDKTGTATITVTGKAPYTGTLKKTFRITPFNIAEKEQGQFSVRMPGGVPGDFNGALDIDAWIASDNPTQWYRATYSKSGAKPEPTVVNVAGSRVMEAGRDYTLQWSNCTAAYTKGDRTTKKNVPTVTITGKGTYTGKITRHYLIDPASISLCTMTATDVNYADQPGFYRRTVVRVTDPDGKVLSANTDYRIEEYGNLAADDKPDPGTQIRVKVTGTGNYNGSNYADYHVIKYNIASANIIIKDQTYADGDYIEPGPDEFPDVKVRIGGKDVVLKYGEAFEADVFSCENNRMPGTARVRVYGCVQNGYGGTKIVTFKIKKREADDNSIIVYDPDNNEWTKDHRPAVSYSPAECRPRPSVYYRNPNGSLTGLIPDTDYVLSWRNNTKSATANGSGTDPIVTLTFKGNYTGKVERHFSINKMELTNYRFRLAVTQSLRPYTEKKDNGSEELVGMIYKKSGMKEVLTENESGKKVGNSEYQVTYEYDWAQSGTTIKIRRLNNNLKYEEEEIWAANDDLQEGDIIPAGTPLRVSVKSVKNSDHYDGDFIVSDPNPPVYVLACNDIGTATITPPDLEYEPHRIIGEGQVADESTITAPEERFEVKVRIGTKTMILDPDCYGLTDWKNNHHAGTAQVTVNGIESKGYGGSKTVNVKINPFSFTENVDHSDGRKPNTDMMWQEENGDAWEYFEVRHGVSQVLTYEYDPSGVCPRPLFYYFMLTDEETFREELTEGTDYTISYRNNKKSYVFEKGIKSEEQVKELRENAPAVIFTGKGDFGGSFELYFAIKSSEIDDRCTVTVPDVIWQDKAGNFKLRSQDVAVTDDRKGTKLQAGTDYEAELIYLNWNKDKDAVFVIRPGHTEPVLVGYRGRFEPDDIVPAGTKIAVWVTGKGNYRGDRPNPSQAYATYYLLYANNLNSATVKINDKDYTGGAIDLTKDDIKVSMRVGGKTMDLEKGTHYKIVYEGDHTKAGTVKVRIEGIPSGGFKGSKAATFKIKAYTMK